MPLLDWALDALAPGGAVRSRSTCTTGRDADRRAPRSPAAAGGGRGARLARGASVALGTAGAHRQRCGAGSTGGRRSSSTPTPGTARTWPRFADGWDGERVRLLTSSPLPFGPRSGVVASLLPWSVARCVSPRTPSGLWEHGLATGARAGSPATPCTSPGSVIDCATPADYLRANLRWSGGASVLGAGAVVEGSVTRSVVWPGDRVAPGEVLVDAIRAEGTPCWSRHAHASGPDRAVRAQLGVRRRGRCTGVASWPGTELPARGVDLGAPGVAHGDVHPEAFELGAERPYPVARRATHRVAGGRVQRDQVHVRPQRARQRRPGVRRRRSGR